MNHRFKALSPLVALTLTLVTLTEPVLLADPAPDLGRVDTRRVEKFLDAFTRPTFRRGKARREKLDERIRDAGLSLADKAAALRKLSPRSTDGGLGALTGVRDELRMERIFLSVAAEDLPLLKFDLEYDGDYKDLEEYLFHDIDSKKYRDPVLRHFLTSRKQIGIKVLSDVDDTLYANLIDRRYPKTPSRPYPGVLEFYNAVQREPFDLESIPLTTLSARPNPIAGFLEEGSLEKLAKFTDNRLRPSGLSGKTLSSALGSLETVGRAHLDHLSDHIPDGQEQKIGQVKFENFWRFSQIYPEYSFVFVGDSGQADALTTRLMIEHGAAGPMSKVITTFIHDLRKSPDDDASVSPSFKELAPGFLVGEASARGRGIIVFRNYIEAAFIAYQHSATLNGLITADELATVTHSALCQFLQIPFPEADESATRLRRQYWEDAEKVDQTLRAKTTRSTALEKSLKEIRRIMGGDSGPCEEPHQRSHVKRRRRARTIPASSQTTQAPPPRSKATAGESPSPTVVSSPWGCPAASKS